MPTDNADGEEPTESVNGEEPTETDAASGHERAGGRGARWPASRRRVLQGVAAAGTVGGVAGLGLGRRRGDRFAGQEGNETTEPGTTPTGEAGFFEPGTEVGVEVVAEGMTAPTDFAVADEEQQRWFVSDQTGEVWVVTPEGGRQETPFVDVGDRMVTLGEFAGDYASDTQEYDERGLLGIEFHPEFAENRRFYLHYSAPRREDMPENWDHVEVVSEFMASEELDAGQPDSERRLLEIESPQYNHDSGPMAFGPDGYLYVPMGDGGGADDDMYGHVDDWYGRNAGGNGQDVEENLLGNVLRIDVDEEGADRPYAIPDDNPFAGPDSPGLDEIYAYGFRNPFGISFDSEGNLFVADAGQNLWEEADVVERGGNYGWNVKEGTHCFSTESPSDPEAITDCPETTPDEPPHDGRPLVDPIVEFPHEFQGQSVGITIIGGHRYENDAISGLQGKYVFGAWTTDVEREQPEGRVLAATPPEDFDGAGTATPGTPADNETADDETEVAVGNETETGADNETDVGGGVGVPREELWEMEELVVQGEFGYFVRMFGRDADGQLYVLVSRRGVPQGDTGAVLRLVPPGEAETPAGTPADNETGETPTDDETVETPTGNETGADNETDDETA